MGPESSAFSGHWSVNFQLILDYFISNFKLKHEDSGNIKTYHVNTIIFNLHQTEKLFMGHLIVPINGGEVLERSNIDEQTKEGSNPMPASAASANPWAEIIAVPKPSNVVFPVNLPTLFKMLNNLTLFTVCRLMRNY